MALMAFKNNWGSPESGVDQQRSDLFKVVVDLPSALKIAGPNAGAGGANVWEEHIAWAVSKFPFPPRDHESIPIKYLNLVNHQPGGRTALEPVTMSVRYAFNQRTAEILERWFELTSSRRNGATGLASKIKCWGHFYWLIPDINVLGNLSAANPFIVKEAYRLEGCWLKSLKPSDANMEEAAGLVSYDVGMAIDDYYPFNPTDLQLVTAGR